MGDAPGIDFEETKRILAVLEREGVQYVLIGAMAMAAQGLIRATHDLDFFVLVRRFVIKTSSRKLCKRPKALGSRSQPLACCT